MKKVIKQNVGIDVSKKDLAVCLIFFYDDLGKKIKGIQRSSGFAIRTDATIYCIHLWSFVHVGRITPSVRLRRTPSPMGRNTIFCRRKGFIPSGISFIWFCKQLYYRVFRHCIAMSPASVGLRGWSTKVTNARPGSRLNNTVGQARLNNTVGQARLNNTVGQARPYRTARSGGCNPDAICSLHCFITTNR